MFTFPNDTELKAPYSARNQGDLKRGLLPPWLKKRRIGGATRVSAIVKELRLSTVCQEALCPNMEECFSKGTATILILGDVCTRGCGFCGVDKGMPLPPDEGEPHRVSTAVRRMGLRHVVITSVTRDDLADGGSEHYHKTILALKELKGIVVEALVPDFQGRKEALAKVLEAGPDILSHNVETVPRLYTSVRHGASYKRSLGVLEFVKKQCKNIKSKSGMMLGLGEDYREVLEVLKDLRKAGCEILTLGQYLRPSKEHLPVHRFLRPEEFGEYKRLAITLGFQEVKAGPFIRSSYHFGEC